jgi:hypothetical protein
MAKRANGKEFPAKRKFALRRDASVGAAQREIERVFRLPKGSIQFHLPSGRRARTDKSIGALLVDYDWVC